MCYGESVTVLLNAQSPLAAAELSAELVVIQEAAPPNLLLQGVVTCKPYTGFRSMVELTNELVTAGARMVRPVI